MGKAAQLQQLRSKSPLDSSGAFAAGAPGEDNFLVPSPSFFSDLAATTSQSSSTSLVHAEMAAYTQVRRATKRVLALGRACFSHHMDFGAGTLCTLKSEVRGGSCRAVFSTKQHFCWGSTCFQRDGSCHKMGYTGAIQVVSLPLSRPSGLLP